MMKVVLKLELRDGDEKAKQKAMTTASGLSGVESVAMDMKDKKLTITGNLDPVKVVGKLRKICPTEILTVGPVKQEDNNKKKEDGAKKDDGGGGAKKDNDAAAKKDDKQQAQSKDQKKPAGGGDQTAAVKVFPQPPPQFYYQYQNYPPPQMIQQQHQQQPYNMNYYPNHYNYRQQQPEHDQSDTCVIS